MNVSYRWLQKLAPTIVEPPEAVAERLTAVAVPVDEVVSLGGKFQDIVVGRVIEVASHPNADRLFICQVDTGAAESVQVVTGAPKVAAGACYPFVGVGGTLPGGLTLKRAKLRGEYSEGMLCSERELELGRDQEGIMLLQGEFEPGTPLVEALGLDDHMLVLDITANRPDLLGHYGVAREVAPGGEADLELPAFPGHDSVALKLAGADTRGEAGGISILIEDTQGCARFVGVAIRGVQVGPSPEWLARDLRAVGQQPINNVVDATNYVMQELNQPIHAYDLPMIGGGKIVVRCAHKGESVRTLDGKTRELNTEVLVIGDGEGVNGLAGLMGGEASEVTEHTTDLFLEAAFFDPLTIRRGARSLGMDTDASYRFQRGIDRTATHKAMERVVNLVLATAGGRLESGVDLNPNPPLSTEIELRTSRVGQLLGIALKKEQVISYIEPLGFAVTDANDERLDVTVPGWRPDVEREVDLIEEVARRHGYDQFPDELGPFRVTRMPEEEFAGVFHRLRDFFVAAGFLESRAAPFAPEEEGEIRILNPLSELESHLRSDLLAGLGHSIERNFAQGLRDVRLFELGTAFTGRSGSVPVEHIRIAAAWTGSPRPPHWTREQVDFDLWDLKWLVESAARIATRGAEVRPVDPADEGAPLEATFAVVARDGQLLGWAGRLPADRLDTPPWAGVVWGLELEVVSTAPPELIYRQLPVYPSSQRDIALIVPRSTLAAEVEQVIRAAAPEFLDELMVFDVYEGEKLPEGTRSIAWRLRFRSPDRTLTDKEVDAATRRIVSTLQKELNVGIRGA